MFLKIFYFISVLFLCNNPIFAITLNPDSHIEPTYSSIEDHGQKIGYVMFVGSRWEIVFYYNGGSYKFTWCPSDKRLSSSIRRFDTAINGLQEAVSESYNYLFSAEDGLHLDKSLLCSSSSPQGKNVSDRTVWGVIILVPLVLIIAISAQ
jgi:hypothetical protein